MAFTSEIWEDSGAPTGSPAVGTIRQEVDNVGWKDSASDETFPFVDYPIQQPISPTLHSLSYTKYNYFKIDATGDSANLFRVTFEGEPSGNGGGSGVATGARLYYKWTNIYEAPTNSFMGGSYLEPNNMPLWLPLTSTIGPEYATSSSVTSGIFYTQYLVTQLYVEPGAWDDYGNLSSSFKLKVTYNQTVTGYPEYDPTHLSTVTIRGVY